MRVVLVMDQDWRWVGESASDLEAADHEVMPFRSPLRALHFCQQPENRFGGVFIHLDRSGPGAGLWLAGQIAGARPDVVVVATSAKFRTVPATMPRTIQLWPKYVTSDMLREVFADDRGAWEPRLGSELRSHCR